MELDHSNKPKDPYRMTNISFAQLPVEKSTDHGEFNFSYFPAAIFQFSFKTQRKIRWLQRHLDRVYLFIPVQIFLLLTGIYCMSSTFCVLFLCFAKFLCFVSKVSVIVFIDLVVFSPAPYETGFPVKNDQIVVLLFCYNAMVQIYIKGVVTYNI